MSDEFTKKKEKKNNNKKKNNGDKVERMWIVSDESFIKVIQYAGEKG